MRTKHFLLRVAVLAAVALLTVSAGYAQRQMEKLTRGVMAMNIGEGKSYVSWRLMGTDPDGIAFNLYKSTGGGAPVKLNAQPLTKGTNFTDASFDAAKSNRYFVKTVIGNKEADTDAGYTMKADTPVQQYISIPLQTPQGSNTNDCSTGDLDGDGEYEIIVKQEMINRDNSQPGVTGETCLEAYKLNGTMLWRINLGHNIREGAHYTQFMVFDLDGDGKAEVACKTADGTVDGTGKVIGDAKVRYANAEGHILSGPEFLTVFNGLTGAAIQSIPYNPGRHPETQNPTSEQLTAIWGDPRGNRSDRYLACIAYLDGVHPSLVMCRGYYTRAFLAAYDFKNGKLVPRWTFDTLGNDALKGYMGQGNHQVSVADVDADGKDEIVYGAAVIDDNGKGLYETGLGHGDAMHVGDLDPARPGLEVFQPHERRSQIAGAEFRDARTGKLIWGKPSVSDNGRGASFDIDPRYLGSESWSSANGPLFNVKGDSIAPKPRTANFAIWWDADLLRELLNSNTVSKWDWTTSTEKNLFVAEGCSSNNGTKSTPALSADLFGDWREELVLRTTDNKELRIFSTTIPTDIRLYTLMHDPQYRVAVAWQNVAYNQPPHVGFYLGDGMKPAPKPNIFLK